MPDAPPSSGESALLAALELLRDPDPPSEPGFDDLSELARTVLEVPYALVSLVEARGHADAADESLVIEDLAADDRTSGHAAVGGDPKLRFYAGVPIRLATGEVAGSFCVLDTRSRELSADQVGMLERLASSCAALLEVRRKAFELDEVHRRMAAVQEAAPVALLHLEPVRDARTRIVDFHVTGANATANRMLQARGVTLSGSNLLSRLPKLKTEDGGAVFNALVHSALSGDSSTIECDYEDRHISLSMRWKIARMDGELVVSVEDIGDTREHQRQLQARDELLEQFVANSPAAIAMFDTEMRYLVAADGWRRDYGLGDAELAGRSHYEIFPEIGDEWKALHRRALAGESLSRERDRFERSDGSVQFLRWRLQPWRDAAGAVGGVIMLTEDITDRVDRELELESQRSIIEMAGQLSQTGGWSYDVDERRLRWTAQTRRIFGVPDDFVPTVDGAIAMYHGRAADTITALFGRAIEHAEPYDTELEIKLPTGEIRLTRSIGKPIVRDGRVVRVAGSVQDVTDEVSGHLEMVRAKELLEQAEKTSQTGGWAYDVSTESIFWTPHVYAMHEVDEDWVPDVTTALAFYTGDSKPVVSEAFTRAVERGEPFDLELEIETAKGQVVPVRAVGQPIVEDGRVVRVAGSFQDLTEIRRRESEERRLTSLISSITDASSDVIFVKDRDGVVLFCNPAYAEVFGRPIDELIGMCEYEGFSDPETVERLRSTDQAVMERGLPLRVEERVHLPATGEPRIFSTEKHPYRLPDGSVGGVIGVSRDISELRAAIEEVRTSSLRLNFALEAANVGFWDHDLVTDEVYYADTWFTMLGYTPGELPMSSECFWEELLHPEDRDEARRHHDAYLAGEIDRCDVVVRLLNKSGAWQWIRDIGRVVERDADGRPTRVVGVHVDIDESKRTQDRLETALVAANEGLWEWNLLDNRCFFDDQWYRLLGYEPGEIPMTFETWESLCHPEDIGLAKQQLGDYLAGVAPSYEVEHRLWTKDGGWKWILGTGRITERDGEGRPLRLVGVNLDIDERRHAAESLENAVRAAETANAAKSQFLANMSHEIRTPMTAIVGYAELMTSEPSLLADADRLRETAGIVKRNGEHLLNIINDILDISKIDAGKMTTEMVHTDLLDLINDVCKLHESRASHKGLRLEVQQRDPLPDTVLADPVRVRQVLMNLINNAIKFTESGGVTIRIEVLGAPADRQGSDAAEARPTLRLSVIDSGIGMTDAQVERLFGTFQQADDSMARRFGGTGLGLAISKRLAELMKGELTVRSRFGSGTTFNFELPLVVPEEARWIEPGATHRAPEVAAESSAANDRPLEGVRVLLVEDGLDNQRLISHHLRKSGASIAVAENGKVGVDLVRQSAAAGRPFDLVLMDMQMPVMDGYTATRTLRNTGETLPIIALTAHAMTGDRERCIGAGCDGYETKPISRAKLVALCGKLLAERRRAA